MGLVAHFGSFDVESFGDLLLPVILERRLADLDARIVHVSPLGGRPVWDDCVSSVSVYDFAKNPPPGFSGIVVGGGHITHTSPNIAPRSDQGASSGILTYPGLWLGAAVLAAQQDVPYCWNAPGVTQPLSPVGSGLIGWTASIADYLAVRDHTSRTRLRDAGVTRPFQVVPDTLLDVTHLWSAAELDAAFQEAFSSRGQPASDRVVVFHLDQRYADDRPALLAARLDRITHRVRATPILIAIMPRYGDDRLQREVGTLMRTNPLVIDHPRNLREVVACLARAQAYLGSSLHGLIVASAFGTPGLGIVPPHARALNAFLGFLELLQLPRWLSPDWEAAELMLDAFLRAPRDPWINVTAVAAESLDNHWRVLRRALEGEPPTPREVFNAVNKRTALAHLAFLLESTIDSNPVPDTGLAGGQPPATVQVTPVHLREHLSQVEVSPNDEPAHAPAIIDSEKYGSAEEDLQSRVATSDAELAALHATVTQERAAADQARADVDQMRVDRDRARKELQALRGHVLLRNDDVATALGAVARQVSLLAVVLARAQGRLSSKGKSRKASDELAIAGEELTRLRGNIETLIRSVQESALPDTSAAPADAGQNRPDGPAQNMASPLATQPTRPHHATEHAVVGALPLSDSSSASALRGALHEPVDIIVCVHNARDDVQRCLDSVVLHTSTPYRLIIVDDGSERTTATYLQGFVQLASNAVLLRNDHARGYTQAANQGLRASTSSVVVLLNSDTIVTPHWLDHLLACLQSDPQIGVAGPLSNAASYQSVPERFEPTGDWALNPAPPGWDTTSIAAAVEQLSPRAFPRVPFVNGFCLAIKRAVIDAIGFFDEAGFPDGYGEENDFCLRAADAGFALAIADQAYVYHAKSRSYSHQRRRTLGRSGRETLISKHGLERLTADEAHLRDEPHLAAMRAELAIHLREMCPHRHAPELSVLFLLPVSGGGGGAHSVVQEASGMRRLGVNAQVAIRAQHLARYQEAYPDIYEREQLFFAYRSVQELQAYAAQFSVVVATIYTSIPLLAEIVAEHPHVLPAYYIQDYEPFFYPEGSPGRAQAARSYTHIPGAVLFAKTRWLCDTIAALHQVVVHKVSPSLDHAVYHPPASPRANGPARVAAMIRPSSPRRGAGRTMEVLRHLSRATASDVDIHVFGASDLELAAAGLALHFPLTNHGVLTRERVAELLRASDIFLDLSDYQAFGRTGLEAMACGCAVVLPALGGTSEYAIHGENALLVDTSNTDICVEAARALVDGGTARRRLQQAGIAKAAEYTIERAAQSEIALLTRELQAHHRLRSKGRATGSRRRCSQPSSRS